MNRANINIKDSNYTFKYLIEYNRLSYGEDVEMTYFISKNRVDLCSDRSHWIKYNNDWIDVVDWAGEEKSDYLPKTSKMCNIKLYYPEFSVDTYSNTYYMLTANTWVNGMYVYLGSYLFNRLDAVATDSIVSFEGNKYYEYDEINILDPRDIVYSDSWKEWRHEVCGEPIIGDDENYNSVGAQINFTLYPVQEVDDKYMILNGHSGGQNGMNISSGESDYLNMHTQIAFNDSVEIEYSINFNSEYDGDLMLYLKETYNLDDVKCVVRLATNGIISNNDVVVVEKDFDEECKFVKNDIKQLSITKGWPVVNGEFMTGLYVNTSLSIIKPQQDLYIWKDPENIASLKLVDLDNNVVDEYQVPSQLVGESYRAEMIKSSKLNPVICNGVYYCTEGQQFIKLTHPNDVYYIKVEPRELLYIISNSIPLTQELHKYLIVDENKIDLNTVNMNHYNINAINKIENNVVKVDGVNDAKSNIIHSVFFRTKDAQDLLIHPLVTENICINLDQYKSKVDSFILKIEDFNFNQIGSTSSGIIFKVIGGKISTQKTSGIYYVLNQDSELVTSGKYISVF